MFGSRNSTFGLWGVMFVLLFLSIVTVATFWWMDQKKRSVMDGRAALEMEWKRATQLEETISSRRRWVNDHPLVARALFLLGEINPLFDMPSPQDVLNRFTAKDKPTADIALLARRALAEGDDTAVDAAEVADMLQRRVRKVEKEIRLCVVGMFLSFLFVLLGGVVVFVAIGYLRERWRRIKGEDGLFMPGGGPHVKVRENRFHLSWWTPRLKLANQLFVFMDKDIRSRLPRSEVKGTVLWILRLLKAHHRVPASPFPRGHEGDAGGLLRHSLHVGSEMFRRVGEDETSGSSTREALVAGLAHDLGKILVFQEKGVVGGIHDNLSAFVLRWSPAFVKEFDEQTRDKILAAVGHHHVPDNLPMNDPWRNARDLLTLLVKVDRSCALQEYRRKQDDETNTNHEAAGGNESIIALLEKMETPEGVVDGERGIFWVPEVVLRRGWLREQGENPEKAFTGTGTDGPPASWDSLLKKLADVGALHDVASTAPRGLFDIEVDGEKKRFRVPLRMESLERMTADSKDMETMPVTVLGPSLAMENDHAHTIG